MIQNFSSAPYFDDYAQSKGFYQVLFKADKNIQARELNQVQSIFQNQLKTFADHVFKNGTKVSNARSQLVDTNYITLSNHNIPKISFQVGNFIESNPGQKSGGVLGIIVHYEEDGGDGFPVVYVDYIAAGDDNKTFKFNPNDSLALKDKTTSQTIGTLTVRCPDCPNTTHLEDIVPVGKGQLFIIDEGVFYFNGFFLEIQRQVFPANRYGLLSNYMVGIDVGFDIINYIDDVSLMDNAVNTPNYLRAGADRYAATLTVSRYNLTDSPADFIKLMTVEEGGVTYILDDSQYADLGDMLAKRTYEESGHYTVSKQKTQFIQHKAAFVGDPNGLYIDGDENKFVAIVDPIVAYVNGYRVESLSKKYIELDKARDTKKIKNFAKVFEEGTYVVLKPIATSCVYPNHDTGTGGLVTVTIHATGVGLDGVPTGPAIGECIVSDVTRHIISATAGETQYKYFISSITMYTGHTISEAVTFFNSTRNFSALVYNTSGEIVKNGGKHEQFWKLAKSNIKSLKEHESGDNSLIIMQHKMMSGTADSTGKLIFTANQNETFQQYNPLKTIAYKIDEFDNPINIDVSTTLTTDGTTLTIDSPSLAGLKIYLLHDTLTSNISERKKTLTARTDALFTTTALNETVTLAKADIRRIVSIKAGLTDLTDSYVLDNGQRDHAYLAGSISVKKGKTVSIGTQLTIKYEYYEHSAQGNVLTVDSYMDMVNDIAIDYAYENIGSYRTKNGKVFNLTDIMDFRPVIIGGIKLTTNIVPSIETVSLFDIEYYMGRVDTLCVTDYGDIIAYKGISSDNPKPINVPKNLMPIYELIMAPFCYSMNDIKLKYIENKRYTMRDVEKIDDRLKVIESYTVLSLLEKSAADMEIKDVNGYDRFKNGFVADNFTNFQACDIGNPEFRASLDREYGELRPEFKARKCKLKLDEAASFGYTKVANVVCLPWTDKMVDYQPYATKHISVNPHFKYTKKGKIVLSPDNDIKTDETRLPNLEVNVDTGTQAFNAIAERTGLVDGSGLNIEGVGRAPNGISKHQGAIDVVVPAKHTYDTIVEPQAPKQPLPVPPPPVPAFGIWKPPVPPIPEQRFGHSSR